MGMGTEMGMVNTKWEGNGNSSLEEIPVSRVNHIFWHYIFQRACPDLVVVSSKYCL